MKDCRQRYIIILTENNFVDLPFADAVIIPPTKTSTASRAQKTKAVKEKGTKEPASKAKSSKAKHRQVLKTKVEPEKGRGGHLVTAAATLS